MHSDKNKAPYGNRTFCLLPFQYRHVLWHTFSPIRAILIVLFLSGCCPDVLPGKEMVHINKTSSLPFLTSQSKGSTLDIFTFEDDRLRRLDSYQRIEQFAGNTAYAESTGGKKIFFFCLCSHRSAYEWADMNSYSSLGKVRFELEDETRGCLTRTGECRALAGDTGAEVVLKPLVASICLKKLSCDFSGTPYAGSKLTDIRAYLTNVNGTSGLLDPDHQKPERIINQGMLNEYDLRGFSERDLVFSDIAASLGRSSLNPDVCFLCYPNPGNTNSPGSPCTRLVIEGKIGGITYYWPVSITGIERGCRYEFDIHIRRKGTSDPDIPVEMSECEIQFETKPWEEKEDYGIRF